MSLTLVCIADLALLEGKPEQATILAAAAARLSEELGGTPPFESVGIAHPLERARAELAPERYDAAVAQGREAPIDEIVQLALAVAAGALDIVDGTFKLLRPLSAALDTCSGFYKENPRHAHIPERPPCHQ